MNPRLQTIKEACVRVDPTIIISGSLIRDITPEDIIAAFQLSLGIDLEDATAAVRSHWDNEVQDLHDQPDEYIEYFYNLLK